MKDRVAASWPQSQDDLDFLRSYDDSTYAVVAVDGTGNFVYANRAAGVMLGWDGSELLGMPLRSIMPEDYHQRYEHSFARYLETHEHSLLGSATLVPMRMRDGSEKEVAMRLEGYVLPRGSDVVVAVMSSFETGAAARDDMHDLRRT